ncbi:FecCD family ABC transporter permease [Vulgatibacter incomptus]|uniref:Hemin ABC transporter, permease protein n=1 Tax=Vulgatibacter incomptus TaxID=1391653 RepID=A0A0K1PCW9_9BACT|nr:iron ABC transporter permease [Vulgatibacter incomptus]AKU90969.1 Hemin ABC transporter, permease protein [Vulgatibacter incomptus]
MLGLAFGLAAVSIVAAGIGAVSIPPGELVEILGQRLGLADPAAIDPGRAAILFAVRLPRVVLGTLVGAAIGLCGVLLQGLFRNPLADPGLLGISGGAALAAATATVFGDSLGSAFGISLGGASQPAVAFLGALATTWIVRRVALAGGRTDVSTLLLAGVALASLAGAGTGLLSHLATESQLRSITAWSLGSLGGATWQTAAWVAVPVILLLASAPRLYRPLDALLLGEREAGHLGIEVESLKARIVILASLAAGAAVASSGIIGFVGLVVPHLLRQVIGPGHRFLLPASALGGAILLLCADLVARTAVAPAELPIGVLTSAIGAPFFLFLLVRNKRRHAE